MKKIYEVVELYEFDGVEIETTIFDTMEKAKAKFEQIIKKEEETSWIKNMLNGDELNDPLSNSELEHEETYYHAYDGYNFYATTIYIREKEIL